MNKLTYILALLFVVSLLLGCGGEIEEEDIGFEETTDTLSADIKQNIGLIRSNIPSPSDLAKEVAEGGFNYNKSILNATSNASRYSSSYKAALNLGVYGADLSYITGFQSSQDIINYLEKIKSMANNLDVSAAFDEKFAKTVIDNISNGDTLRDLIDKAYGRAESNLRSYKRVSTMALIITGGWIEGLYVATEIGKGKENTNLYTKTWDHIYAFKYVVELLDAFKNESPDCAKALQEVEELNKTLKNYLRNSELKKTQIEAINQAVTPVRNKIIS